MEREFESILLSVTKNYRIRIEGVTLFDQAKNKEPRFARFNCCPALLSWFHAEKLWQPHKDIVLFSLKAGNTELRIIYREKSWWMMRLVNSPPNGFTICSGRYIPEALKYIQDSFCLIAQGGSVARAKHQLYPAMVAKAQSGSHHFALNRRLDDLISFCVRYREQRK